VTLDIDDAEPDTSQTENAPLRIILQTEQIVIVDKPAGQPSVPARPRGNAAATAEGTLAYSLAQQFPEMQGIGYSPSEAGLLHRLDTQTSGLVLAARNKLAFDTLKRALSQNRIEKRYFALVKSDDRLVSMVLDAPLKPDPRNPRRVVVCHAQDPRANSARTEITPLRRGRNWTLLDIKASRAYRHQIRAHLADLGFPLAGDVLYGAPHELALGARHALHAHYIAWSGDATVLAFAARSPLPESFAELAR
jgi:23S rRNA pseudouridine1911/1915/1917 synthase